MSDNDNCSYSEIRRIDDWVHAIDKKQAQIEVILIEVKKRIHKLDGGLSVMSSAQEAMHDKLMKNQTYMEGFESKLIESKQKILNSLDSINKSFESTNEIVETISHKVSALEESSKFKRWLYEGVSKNYKLAVFGISCLGGGAYVTHAIERMFR